MRSSIVFLSFISCATACGDDDEGAAATDTTIATETGATETTATETTEADTVVDAREVSDGACIGRVCGPDPVTHEDCGGCDTPGLRACNDGVCEATCAATACAAMSYEENTCVAGGECDGSPEGAITSATFTCSEDGTRCDVDMSAVDCGLSNTDCAACSLGFCEDDVCKPAAETDCRPATCGARVCGPAPGTHESCGACPGSAPACNDGVCAAVCDPIACARLTYSEVDCVASSECDGSPDGAVTTTTFACDGNVCAPTASAVDCGLVNTDCAPCDFEGGAGLCEGEICKASDATSCQ